MDMEIDNVYECFLLFSFFFDAAIKLINITLKTENTNPKQTWFLKY